MVSSRCDLGWQEKLQFEWLNKKGNMKNSKSTAGWVHFGSLLQMEWKATVSVDYMGWFGGYKRRGKLDDVNGFVCSHLLGERLCRLQGRIPPSYVAKWGDGKGVVSHTTKNKENLVASKNQSAAWMVLIWGTLWTRWRLPQQWYLAVGV